MRDTRFSEFFEKVPEMSGERWQNMVEFRDQSNQKGLVIRELRFCEIRHGETIFTIREKLKYECQCHTRQYNFDNFGIKKRKIAYNNVYNLFYFLFI